MTTIDQKQSKGVIIASAKIRTCAPLHIGSGLDKHSDLDILLDTGGKPIIPSTSFVGVLKHSLPKPVNEDAKWNEFWGYSDKDDGRESSFVCSDLEVDEHSSVDIAIRDGIRMDNQTGMVEEQAKYNYEIVDYGIDFIFRMEFRYTDDNEPFVRRMIATIFHTLSQGHILLGAKTSSGLGKVELVQSDVRVWDFNFDIKRDVACWLLNDFGEGKIYSEANLGEHFQQSATGHFSIDSEFKLVNSIIIRTSSIESDIPDTVHLTAKRGKDNVLSGTSLKGPLRSRGMRILRTLDYTAEQASKFLDSLFGFVINETHTKDSPNAKRSRVRLEETVLPSDFSPELQTRIKIDRFTSGTIDSAIFNSMPLFSGADSPQFHIKIDIEECSEAESGLMVLLLKDLWTGDLAIGGEKNVGRGLLQGISVTITKDGESIASGSLVDPENTKKLQPLVNALIDIRREI